MKKIVLAILSVVVLSCSLSVDVVQEMNNNELVCQSDSDCNHSGQASCLRYYCNNGYCDIQSECEEPLKCPKEYLDCDGDRSNGCETLSDGLNCGACGVDCKDPTPYCMMNVNNPLPHCDRF